MSKLDTSTDIRIEQLEDEIIALSGFGSFRAQVSQLNTADEFETYRKIASRATGLCRSLMHNILGSYYSKWYKRDKSV